MTKCTLLGALVLVCCVSHAQFAPVGSTWNHAILDPSNYPEQQHVRTVITKDTLIESRVYSVFENTLGQRYFKSLDSGRVYFYALGDHHLFFDLNASTGDTLVVDRRVGQNEIVQQAIVIDTVFDLADRSGNRVKAYSFGDRLVCEKFLVARNGKNEGMASEDVLGFTYGSSQSFYCYREPNGFQFNRVDSAACDRVGDPERQSQQRWVHPFPNPANRFLTISALHPNWLVTLYDILGNAVASQLTTINGTQIDVSELPAGCYWLKAVGVHSETVILKIMVAH